MQPQQHETAFHWIRDGRDARRAPENVKPSSPEWPGVLVSNLIPPIFEAYAKILHRIDAHYEFIDHPLSPKEIAILKIPACEPLKSFVAQRRADAKGARIKWRDLAELLEVPFAPEICHEWYRKKLMDSWCWPRLLGGPSDGALSVDEREELASTAKLYSAGGECLFRFSDVPFYGSDRPDMPRVFKGTLDELDGFPKEGAYRIGPEYWWPPENKWCVCSDYDLMYTIVGGPNDLISALTRSSVLECLPVSPQTRVDPFAPMPR